MSPNLRNTAENSESWMYLTKALLHSPYGREWLKAPLRRIHEIWVNEIQVPMNGRLRRLHTVHYGTVFPETDDLPPATDDDLPGLLANGPRFVRYKPGVATSEVTDVAAPPSKGKGKMKAVDEFSLIFPDPPINGTSINRSDTPPASTVGSYDFSEWGTIAGELIEDVCNLF